MRYRVLEKVLYKRQKEQLVCKESESETNRGFQKNVMFIKQDQPNMKKETEK